MRLIDADTLKESVNDKKVVGRFNTIQLIDNAPTICERYRSFCMVKPERPQGEWIEDSGNIACSECGTLAVWIVNNDFGSKPYISNFCPNCGADMKGGRE